MLSIVMAHFKRETLLDRTLWAYRHYHSLDTLRDVEFIIIDDDGGKSQHFWNVIAEHGKALNIFATGIDEGTYCPCIPLNFAIKQARGNVVVITNPECLPFTKDLLDQIKKRITNNMYLSCACYSLPYDVTQAMYMVDWKTKKYALTFLESIPIYDNMADGDGIPGWYNHSEYRPVNLHWCTAISREFLVAMGAFDEDFAMGFAYEDNDFARRIANSGLRIQFANDLRVFHQHHYLPTYYTPERHAHIERNRVVCENKRYAGFVRNLGKKWGTLHNLPKRVERWEDGKLCQ